MHGGLEFPLLPGRPGYELQHPKAEPFTAFAVILQSRFFIKEIVPATVAASSASDWLLSDVSVHPVSAYFELAPILPPQSMPLKVFLAEDNLDDAFLFKRAAKDRLQVSHATNGEEACKLLLTEAPPDLFVTDLKMPFKDGFELTRWIRSHLELKNLRIVVLSSSAEERDVRNAHAAGADLFICKPNTIAGYGRLAQFLESQQSAPTKPGELKILYFDFDGTERWWNFSSAE